MKIASARIFPLALGLARPVATAHGRLTRREALRVVLVDTDGRLGRGECAPLPAFGTETLRTAGRVLERLAPRLEGVELEDPPALPAELDSLLEAAPTARAGVDTALHDLASQRAGLALGELLARRAGRRAHATVPAGSLLVETNPSDVADAARRAVSSGFGALKLKVGAGDAALDARRVAAARRGAGPEATLGLDANGAWTPEEALRRIESFAESRVAWVEQPVAAWDVAGLAFVRHRARVSIVADESVLRSADARRVLEAGAADRLALKPAALGGLVAAEAVAERARAAGVEVAVTSFLDGAVGLAAALHFAASLPGPLPPCGLATGHLVYGDDLAPPLAGKGSLAVPRGPGLGLAAAARAAGP